MSRRTAALREDRRKIKATVETIEEGAISFNNDPGGVRATLVLDLLNLKAFQFKFMPDVLKAALELNSYNDRVAGCLLRGVLDDYRDLIKRAKTEGW